MQTDFNQAERCGITEGAELHKKRRLVDAAQKLLWAESQIAQTAQAEKCQDLYQYARELLIKIKMYELPRESRPPRLADELETLENAYLLLEEAIVELEEIIKRN